MVRPPSKWKSKSQKPKPAAPCRFAPAVFRSASPEATQRLCEELAKQAARGFIELTGASGKASGPDLVQQLRASGHDMICVESTNELQQWQATLYHPKATFSLLLTYRAPRSVEVVWRVDDVTFEARA